MTTFELTANFALPNVWGAIHQREGLVMKCGDLSATFVSNGTIGKFDETGLEVAGELHLEGVETPYSGHLKGDFVEGVSTNVEFIVTG